MAAVSNSFVFRPLPLGKPDPTEPRPESGPDSRRRVIQHGAKGNVCWLAGFNLLRARWKAPNTEGRVERLFEQSVSKMRKAICKYQDGLPDLVKSFEYSMMADLLKGITKSSVAENPHAIQLLDVVVEAHIGPAKVALNTLKESFMTQTKFTNLYDYAKFVSLNGGSGIYETFFAEIGVDPEKLHQQVIETRDEAYCKRYSGTKWGDIDPQQKNLLLYQLAYNLVAKRSGLQLSYWEPTGRFTFLVEELEIRGPLVVGGFFGRAYYATKPKKLDRTVMGRPLYGWLKTDPKISLIVGHVIVVVGAEKVNDREYVYYVDSEDASDPDHPEKQVLFCMSYQKLVDNILANNGFHHKQASCRVGYAFHADPSLSSVSKDKPDNKEEA